MRVLRNSIPVIAALALLGQASVLQAEVRRSGVGGRVLGEAAPLAAAHIYAYQLADLSLRKVKTDAQGNFLFQDLPAGLYKVIAHKAGFMPAVIMLTRTTAQTYQFLELQLAQRQAGKGQEEEDDFWAIRARVPADVLRDIERDENPFEIASFGPQSSASLTTSFQTEMQALTGFDQIGAGGGGQLSGAGLGFQGQVGQVQVGLQGRFSQLSSGSLQGPTSAPSPTAQASSLAIDVSRGPGSRVSILSFNNRMDTGAFLDESGINPGPVDFEHYQVNWSQEVGSNGRSEFAAHYTAENNFHRHGLINPLAIPEASQTWRIEGAYTIDFSDRNTLQSGLRYRERQFGFGDLDRPGKAYERQALSSIDLFSRGGVRVQPAVLMEYGLYSTLSDGSLELTPQGGVVLQLGSNWQLETSAARRVYTDPSSGPDFLPTLFAQRDLCEQGSEACYEVNLSRKDEEDDTLTFGAVHRTVGDTLRLYFSEDFFDRLESLYLVRGDKLPEVRFGFRQKISPQVVTTLDSSVAAGGGGTFFGANGQSYENQVRYMVTSLDTQLLASSTGIFVAFHHLEQQLDSMNVAGRTDSQMELERLQLVLNQNLNILLDLASDWTVQLNMELSRGGTSSSQTVADDRVRSRILGGIAVKF
jgi:hypothetical protein